MEPFQISYETINQAVLAQLPPAELVHGCYISEQLGSGCLLDPPGYPSYFIQHVYNSFGNTPRHGTSAVLLGRELERAEGPYDEDRLPKLLRELWVPLPIDHPRTRDWMRQIFGYFDKCWIKVGGSRNTDQLAILPFDLDDPVAPIERYRPVDYIREFYPGWEFDYWFYLNRSWGNALNLGATETWAAGDWWERYTRRPTAAECPGLDGFPHAAANGYCQFCGEIRK